ncbi:hypothetical protein, partial [Anaerotruncus rubiinfantis]|uniref:hypothetical protein n=1 Tax=Anaerotruncus rubiinfantis TaxID=1720200 RepID=UPI0034A21C89
LQPLPIVDQLRIACPANYPTVADDLKNHLSRPQKCRSSFGSFILLLYVVLKKTENILAAK